MLAARCFALAGVLLLAPVASTALDLEPSLAADDTCHGDKVECSLSLRQLRGEQQPQRQQLAQVAVHDAAASGTESEATNNGEAVDAESEAGVAEVSDAEALRDSEELQALLAEDRESQENKTEEEARILLVEERSVQKEGAEGGPVIWAGRYDVKGVESCHGGNVGYCDSLMYRARGACGSASCVLIVNPPGHRTRVPLHIHAYRYNGYGYSVKKRMEAKACMSHSWVHGGFPCGGRAKFYSGFPPVFRVTGSPTASITAWPQSCGGRGTIVLVGYGCSIEHAVCAAGQCGR